MGARGSRRLRDLAQLGLVRARLLAAREAVRRGAEELAGGHDPGGADAGLQRPARGVRGGGVRGGVAGCRQQRV